MSQVSYITIAPNDEGQRLDNYLIRTLKGVPKSHFYRIIRQGEVRINKKRAKPSTKLHAHDVLRVPPIRVSANKHIHVSQSTITLLKQSIIAENEYFMVLNKPAGMAVHGGSGLSLGVIEALRQWRTELSYLELVHRLDKETSGCLLIAKKRRVLKELQRQFAERLVKKTYWALVHHTWLESKQVTVDKPLYKNTLSSGERMVVVSEQGKASLTHIHLLENFEYYALLSVLPQTGRTHQIRVHCAYLKHPIVGDLKYIQADALKQDELNKARLHLHAYSIQFNLDNNMYKYDANLDKAFAGTLNRLRLGSNSTS
ncbi:MAG TPA: RluA family pseudouridine synthase [Legionellales bacterium]|nr:RluA family pseudouridine synthase [Legionellales bacterium]|tara:strand:- start:1047 stop:1988 length:942 start_codon:yes stop_codon:yes gene_type:complete